MSPSTPPPRLPPAGWYSDPDGGGLRWWDGQRWTPHTSTSQPARGDQLPPDAAPSVAREQQSRNRSGWFRRRSNAFFLTAAAIIILVGVAVIVLTAPDGNPRAAFEECRQDAQPVFAAMQGLGSHLDVGVVQSAYAAEVGDVQARYDRLTAKHPSAACQPAVRALGEAMDSYAQASREWNECIFSEEEECAEVSVQKLWSDADRAIATAKQRLNALTGGADAVAAAESEAAQVEADALAKERMHAAQVAMETYATNHGSYEGATPEKLRKIEASLPPSLEVTEAGLEYFAISIPSKGGNWFEIDREIGGGLAFRCGERGQGGCPGNGDWG